MKNYKIVAVYLHGACRYWANENVTPAKVELWISSIKARFIFSVYPWNMYGIHTSWLPNFKQYHPFQNSLLKCQTSCTSIELVLRLLKHFSFHNLGALWKWVNISPRIYLILVLRDNESNFKSLYQKPNQCLANIFNCWSAPVGCFVENLSPKCFAFNKIDSNSIIQTIVLVKITNLHLGVMTRNYVLSLKYFHHVSLLLTLLHYLKSLPNPMHIENVISLKHLEAIYLIFFLKSEVTWFVPWSLECDI